MPVGKPVANLACSRCTLHLRARIGLGSGCKLRDSNQRLPVPGKGAGRGELEIQPPGTA